MSTRIALLRAVNLGQHGKVAMAELKAAAAGMGLKNPRTLLQSGNLVFESDEAPRELERRLEAAAAADLGLTTDIMVRTAGEWREVVAGNPFAAEAEADPSHVVAMVLKTAAPAEAVAALKAASKGPERIEAGERVLYVSYPEGIGRSKLNGVRAWSKLPPGTGRNWNTVLKLAAMAEGQT